MVSASGVSVDLEKVEAIMNWERSKSVFEIRGFLGMVGYIVYCDASKDRLGCVLMQSGRVVAYSSHKLKNHEQGYPTHDMELAAIILSLKA